MTIGQPSQSRIERTWPWLLRLRGYAFLAQLATIAIVRFVLGIDVPVASLLGLACAGGLVNVAVADARRRGRLLSETALAGVLFVDTVLLTGLLHQSGGPVNPFSVLYLVHVALAAVVLSRRYVAAIVLASSLGYALLFVHSVPIAMVWRIGDTMFSAHLQGMWLAFVIAASFVAFFIGRVTSDLASRDEELRVANAQLARTDRLASLATLAAGAAHELATPLATIQLIAGELELEGAPEAIRDDAKLLSSEVARCSDVLRRLAIRSGEPMGELASRLSVAELFARVLERTRSRAPRLVIERDGDAFVVGPRDMLTESLGVLVDNAFDASGPNESVRLSAKLREGRVEIFVEDHGEGMDAASLARLGEPFFSSKGGRGMGLGVFVARRVLASMGGSLDFESKPNEGTRATLRLPVAPQVSPTEGPTS